MKRKSRERDELLHGHQASLARHVKRDLEVCFGCLEVFLECAAVGATYGAMLGAFWGGVLGVLAGLGPLAGLVGGAMGALIGAFGGAAAGCVGSLVGGRMGWSVAWLVGGAVPVAAGWLPLIEGDSQWRLFWLLADLSSILTGGYLGLALGRGLQTGRSGALGVEPLAALIHEAASRAPSPSPDRCEVTPAFAPEGRGDEAVPTSVARSLPR